mgnify:CR=1 FL=1
MIAIVYCTSTAASSLENFAAAIVIPLELSGDGVRLIAWNLVSEIDSDSLTYYCKAG